MRGPSQCHAQHTYAGTHKRALTCVTHTPAHACCNNRQKGPMVDKFRLTALRRAQAWDPRPAVAGYMMFPSQGSRTVTCCCPAADYLRPCRRPSPLATLVPCLLAPGPARPHLAAPHLPSTRGPPVEVRSVAGGGIGRRRCPARRRFAVAAYAGRPRRLGLGPRRRPAVTKGKSTTKPLSAPTAAANLRRTGTVSGEVRPCSARHTQGRGPRCRPPPDRRHRKGRVPSRAAR